LYYFKLYKICYCFAKPQHLLEFNIWNVKTVKNQFLFLNRTLLNILKSMVLELEQKKNISSDSSFINSWMLKSMKSMQDKIPSKLVITSSQLWQILKQKNMQDWISNQLSKNKSLLFLMNQKILMIILTGYIEDTLEYQLETKWHVDHAGLSQQLVQLNLHTILSIIANIIFLNNNLLTAMIHLMDVKEAIHKMLLHMQ